jgi:hypothetical protein
MYLTLAAIGWVGLRTLTAIDFSASLSKAGVDLRLAAAVLATRGHPPSGRAPLEAW